MPAALPERPEPLTKPGGSWVSLVLAACLAVMVTATLIFLTFGIGGMVVLIGGGVFAFAGLHYVVWGWWLSGILRAEHEAQTKRDPSD